MDGLKIKLCDDIARIYKKDINLVLKNTDKSLFCDPFYLTAEQVLYLYFHIKKNYNLSILEEKIIEGHFQSIDKIYSVLY
ncbi:hypothetical protein [Tissierella praeacuta]|uniref:hypothetical protein n=1 Tax=Tissierella praeacuta TaxID=43131 RepID=UPI0033418102